MNTITGGTDSVVKEVAQAAKPQRSAWFSELVASFEAVEACSFLLHTGIDDYERPGVGVCEFLARAFIGEFEVIAIYSVSRGIYFPQLFDKSGALIDTSAMRKRFFEIVSIDDDTPDQPILIAPEPATALLLNFLRLAPKQKAMVMLERVDNMIGDVVPIDAKVISMMEMLHNAGTDKRLIAHGNPLIMLAPDLHEIRSQVRRKSSGIKMIEVPLPDHKARLEFARARLAQSDMASVRLDGITIEQLASLTAGLLRRHLEVIMLRALSMGGNLTRELALNVQREMMDTEYAGIVRRIDKPFHLSDVGGLDEAKTYAERRIVAPLLAGRYEQAPTAVLFVGPPGTGKTMLAAATANDSGLNCLECDLAALMGSLVGQTEKNMALFKQAVIANAPTIVLLDEIDQKARRGEGGADGGGGGAVENRLFAAILELLGDTSLWKRLGVTWVFASNRPKLIDEALMSRMQAVIPILPSASDAARMDVMSRLIHRLSRGKYMPQGDGADIQPLAAQVKDWSNRDLEQAVDDALATSAIDGEPFYDALAESIKYRRADTSSVATQVKEALDVCKDMRLVPERYRGVAAAPVAKPAESEWSAGLDDSRKMRKITWTDD